MDQKVEVILDDVGRLHLPEWLRQRLGLGAGSRLIVERTDEGGALLQPERAGGLVEDGGLLYFEGEPLEDLAAFAERERERRLDDLQRGAGA